MLKNVGISTIVGILVGVIAVWWIEPATGGGTTLIVVVAVLVSWLVRSAIWALRGIFSRPSSNMGDGK
jgi:hypothetical protein